MGVRNYCNSHDCILSVVITFLCRVLWVPKHQILNHCSSSRFIKNSVRDTCCRCAIGFWNNCLNFRVCRVDLLKVQNLSFLIKFNVLYLGGLFFTLLFLGSIMFRARLEWNTGWMWATKYLNGNYIAAIYVIVLLVSIISYAYALWKTWQLTKSDTMINKRSVLAFGWLIGAPLIVASNPLFFISAMRLATDRLFIP